MNKPSDLFDHRKPANVENPRPAGGEVSPATYHGPLSKRIVAPNEHGGRLTQTKEQW